MEWQAVYSRKVRYSDTDAQGIVFNGNYLSYYDDVLTDVFSLAGLDPPAMHAAGYDILTRHAEVDFHATARLGETLVFGAAVERVGTTSITFSLTSKSAESGRTTTTGKVVFVCVDPHDHTPVPVPDSLLEALGHRSDAH